MKTSPTPPPEDGFLDEHPKMKWLATSRTTGVAAVAFVGIVALLVAVIVVRANIGTDDRGQGTAQPATTPSAAAPITPSAPGGSGFGPSIADGLGREIAMPVDEQGQILPQTPPPDRPAFDPAVPVPAPEGMMWQRIGATVAPFSTSDGPTRIDGRLAFGFAHTPQGAALAGWQITARMLRSGDDVREAYARQIVADPGREAATMNRLEASGESDFRTGKALIFPEAFRVASYNENGTFAVVRYATPLGGGTWSAGQAALTWDDGQWKLRDTPAPATTTISSLAGWTRW